jgi:hypothetical protein
MSSSRRLALLLALGFAAATAALAQSSSSSSNPAPDQAQSEQAAAQSQGQISVQARIKARREQRRSAAIHEAYAHRYEAYTGMGYLRFVPGGGTPAFAATSTTPAIPHGHGLERAHEYAWTVGFTRYLDERLGVTAEGRGYYGTAFTGIKLTTTSTGGTPPVTTTTTTTNPFTNPAISEYTALVGPTYRFYVQPKFSVSGRVMGGVMRGIFSGDTNHSTVLSTDLGLWPDGTTYAASASIPVDINVTPHLAARVAPEYFFSGFGSTQQYSKAFTVGLVYRFGKQ